MQPSDQSGSFEPSKELLAAQARLLELRAALGIEVKASDSLSLPVSKTAPAINWPQINAQVELHHRRQQTEVIMVSKPSTLPAIPAKLDANSEEVSATSWEKAVVVHPSVLMAMLKQQHEAAGRVYLLLRAIDRQGRGWLSVSNIRRHLTETGSPLRICGWRRLRQLLAEGEGFFWQRDNQDRLWLSGLHRIAYKLDLDRLQGFPIELPIQALLGGIQATRAAFYAAFHSGRDAKPISRETLEAVSGIARRTQRTYDHIAGVDRQRNVAIGERYTPENVQERAWRHGRAVFHFVDSDGRQGPKNREYIAWHLPNSYEATYQRRSRGSRKRLNRRLKDLLKKGTTGNAEVAVEKLFFPNGALAAKRFNREPENDAYWIQGATAAKRATLWAVIGGQGPR